MRSIALVLAAAVALPAFAQTPPEASPSAPPQVPPQAPRLPPKPTPSGGTGRLSARVIQSVIHARLDDLSQCFDQKTAHAGKVVTHFTIRDDGRVDDATLTQNETGSPALGRCVLGVVRALVFPAPKGGSLEVTYPFGFSDSGAAAAGEVPSAPAPPSGTPIPPRAAPVPPATGGSTPPSAGPKPPGVPTANPARPTFSDNATTTVPGALEIEAGGVGAASGPGLSTLFKYGLAPDMDVRLGWGEGFGEGQGGVVSLMLKRTLREPEPGVVGFAIAPYLSVATPPASNAEGIGAVLIATWPFAGLSLDANVVVQATATTPGKIVIEADPVANLNVPLVGGLGAFVEVYAILGTGGPPQPVAGGGLSLTVRPNLVFDAAVEIGLAPASTPWTVQAGLTWSFYLVPPGKA